MAIVRPCVVCGNPVSAAPWQIRIGKGKYCSQACSHTRTASLHDIYLAQVDRSGGPDACHPWRGAPDAGGYGRLLVDGVAWKAHRFAYYVTHGQIPEDLMIRHRCNNPICVNPRHLLPGTAQDNMDDRDRAGHTYCGEQVSLAKLTTNDVREIRRRYASGESQSSIARSFGIGHTTVGNIVYRRTWRHVD